MSALYAHSALTLLNQGYDPAGKLNVPFSNGNWIANSFHLAQSLSVCVYVQSVRPRFSVIVSQAHVEDESLEG